MSDLTVEILKGIRTELRDLRTDVGDLRTEVRQGFAEVRGEIHDGLAAVNHRLDNVLLFTGSHYRAREERVTALEDKASPPRRPPSRRRSARRPG